MNPDQSKCAVCGQPTAETTEFDGQQDRRVIQCTQCGNYHYVQVALILLRQKTLSSRQRANLSGWLRENSAEGITDKNLDRLLDLPTPTVGERAEKLLVHLGRTHPKPGQEIHLGISGQLEPKRYQPLIAVCWSENLAELQYYVCEYLEKTKAFLKTRGHSYVITPEAWSFLDQLSRNKQSKLAFVAMNFDPKFNRLYDDGIDPAIRAAGYEPKRVDRHLHVYRIDDEIIVLINQSRFAFVDLTEQKQSVYFEAGYAMGLGLKVIWSCRKDEIDEKKIHFDARQFPMLDWTTDTDLTDYRRRLTTHIKAVIR
ncbi:MAG: hypothetical protein HZA91_13165 [Verrucomicrobia bacterium]|nr:hypothetical protein [Verrucomicrobiota bacterium]